MITFQATGDPIEKEDTDQAPARVVFSENGTDLAEVLISENDLKNGNGYVTKSNVCFILRKPDLDISCPDDSKIVLQHNIVCIIHSYF